MNCHDRISHSKQLMKKYLSSDVSIICFTDEKIFTVTTTKNLQTDREYSTAATKNVHTIDVQTVTDDISQRVTSDRQYICLILVWVTAIITMLCCYNTSYTPYDEPTASSSSFSSTLPRRTGRMRQSTFLPVTKVKASHTRCRALGPELIPVYRQ